MRLDRFCMGMSSSNESCDRAACLSFVLFIKFNFGLIGSCHK